MSTVHTRALTDLVAQLATVGPWGINSPGEQFQDWRSLPDSAFPWCAVELASTGAFLDGKAERGRVYELAPVNIWGAVNVLPTGGLPPTVTTRQRAREELLQRVWNLLFQTSMRDRLHVTLAANGQNGCTEILPDTGAERDEGLPAGSPYGVFRLPILLVCQYNLTAL